MNRAPARKIRSGCSGVGGVIVAVLAGGAILGWPVYLNMAGERASGVLSEKRQSIGIFYDQWFRHFLITASFSIPGRPQQKHQVICEAGPAAFLVVVRLPFGCGALVSGVVSVSIVYVLTVFLLVRIAVVTSIISGEIARRIFGDWAGADCGRTELAGWVPLLYTRQNDGGKAGTTSVTGRWEPLMSLESSGHTGAGADQCLCSDLALSDFASRWRNSPAQSCESPVLG
jgi:hypothetical protein